MGKTCFFIGHGDAPHALLPLLTETVARHVREFGVQEFVAGGYGNFDRLATAAVIAVKRQHPEIQLLRLLPYHPAAQTVWIPNGVDGTFYPPGMEEVPKRFAIVRANRYMIEHSTHLIAYVWQTAGNTQKLLAFAKRREAQGLICIDNLAETDQAQLFPNAVQM